MKCVCAPDAVLRPKREGKAERSDGAGRLGGAAGYGRTETVFRQTGRISPAQYERAGEGWSSFFERIEDRLARTQSG